MSAADLAVASLVALVAGVLDSLAGGGSLLLFPALTVFGLPAVSASVTNAVIQWPGYVGAVAGFRRLLREHRAELLGPAVAAVAGGTAGSLALLSTPTGAFDVVVPVLVALASCAVALQPWLRRRLATASAPAGGTRGMRRAGGGRWLWVAIFLACGSGGYFGRALGVVLLAVLGPVLGDLVRANAVKSVLSLLTATCSAHLRRAGPVDWTVVVACAPSSLLGGLLGARLATVVPETPLHIVVVSVGLCAAAWFWLT